jgi:spermidine synthase
MPILITEEHGVRYLEFGAHWIQGAMRLASPWALELDYAQSMMLPLLVKPASWPRSVLQVGLGAGALAKFLHRHRPRARIDVVEIDPEVALYAWTYFHLPPESARFHVELDDAYRFVARTRKRYDLVMVDGFDSRAEAGRLDSTAFYRHCQERLAPGGMLVANLIGKRRLPREGIGRMRGVFGERLVVLPPNEANTIAIANSGRPVQLEGEALARAVRNMRANTGLDLEPVLDTLFRKGRERVLRF